ncbi:MAG: hydantoinase B/oxoprolinase family protein [Kofleriaceae bacterium]|nr:hydantoinase B/oxoprolinase family protein [Kofleriaceae bacterium]
MSIATQMGTVLERTAVSTNIRERREGSCAIFDAWRRPGRQRGAHPGPPRRWRAATVARSSRRTRSRRRARSGATNDPSAGGSHLPDITVITPVHDDAGRVLYILANRGHAADVGGLTPGSMPPASRTLADEGVALRHLPLVEGGALARARILAALAAGPHQPAGRSTTSPISRP